VTRNPLIRPAPARALPTAQEKIAEMTLARDHNPPLLADGPTEELQPGTTLLHGQYRIERFLNSGGFGLTYLARDSLDRTVVIKECFPESLCLRSGQEVRARTRSHNQEFHAIVQLFVEEAHRLSRLNHPGIVGVHQVFTDNTTAYMALDYIDGKNLLEVIEEGGAQPSPEQVKEILVKLLEAVGFIHDQSLLHRDISPDNILIDRSGNPVLIDFGAARERATRTSRVLSRLQVVKDGYSPQEFYVAGIRQGPPSDLYALAATFYHLIAGTAPPNSQVRMATLASEERDPYIPLAGRVAGYDTAFLQAIDKALNVIPKERHQTAHDWLDQICGRTGDVAPAASHAIDAETRDVIARLVAETNHAVMEARKRAESEASARTDEAPRPVERKPFFSWRSLYEDDESPERGLETADESTAAEGHSKGSAETAAQPGMIGRDDDAEAAFEESFDGTPAPKTGRSGTGFLRGGLLDGLASRFMARL